MYLLSFHSQFTAIINQRDYFFRSCHWNHNDKQDLNIQNLNEPIEYFFVIIFAITNTNSTRYLREAMKINKFRPCGLRLFHRII